MSDRDIVEEVVAEGDAFREVREEFDRAARLWGSMQSAHEGYAIILEELDELWEMVQQSQKGKVTREEMRAEACQVAAMAVRFMVDCC